MISFQVVFPHLQGWRVDAGDLFMTVRYFTVRHTLCNECEGGYTGRDAPALIEERSQTDMTARLLKSTSQGGIACKLQVQISSV